MTIILQNLLTSRMERILINTQLALGEFDWRHNLLLHFSGLLFLLNFPCLHQICVLISQKLQKNSLSENCASVQAGFKVWGQ